MGNSEGDVVPAFRQSRSVLDAALQGLELGFAPTLGENGRSWFVGRHERREELLRLMALYGKKLCDLRISSRAA